MLIEGLLLLMLLSFGSEKPPGTDAGRLTVINIKEAPEPSSPEREQPVEKRPVPQRPATKEPLPPQPTEPKTEQLVRAIIPTPQEQPPPAPVNPIRPTAPARPLYGPPDTGGSSASRDSEVVGTAPNGEPLYAAAWYREPADDELRGYLSTARGPGWGLIACRTVPDYRVEDCVALDEYPAGSQINRAVLAATWQFKVRPPRLGGRLLVGSWVRIRIDYGIERR